MTLFHRTAVRAGVPLAFMRHLFFPLNFKSFLSIVTILWFQFSFPVALLASLSLAAVFVVPHSAIRNSHSAIQFPVL